MNSFNRHGFASTTNRQSKAEKIALIIGEKIPINSEKKNWLLDIGTGNGEIASYLGSFFNVISIDIKDQRTYKKNFDFLISKELLPFCSNFFDMVVSNHVIEHVQDSTKHIDEIYRVLKPGGWLYLATPNRLWPWEVHYHLALLHYLPSSLFHYFLKKTGQYKEDINLKTSWQIKSTCYQFKKIESISEKVLKQPVYYKLKVSKKFDSIVSIIPLKIFSIMHLLMPTFIFMMQKGTETKTSILWLTSSYPRFKKDSSSIFLRYLAEAISNKNYKLDILSPDENEIPINTITKESITLHHFKYFFPRSLQKLAYGSGILPNLRAKPFLFIQVPFFLCSQFFTSYQLVKKLKPEHIHAHWVFPQGVIASLIGKIFKIPVIITAHGGDAFALQGSLLARIKRWSIKNCSEWTSNTKATAKALGKEIPQPNIIPMGIDYEKFSSGDARILLSNLHQKSIILLFVGRLVEKKGVNDLLTAYSLFSEDLQRKTQLWIVGDGAEKNSLMNLSQSLNINDKVTFWGKLSNSQLPDYYAAADIFIAPSITDSSGDTEGQGVILLEAMASGTAVISTNTGGIKEVIEHGKTGILTSPKDPLKLKVEIVKLIEHSEQRNSLAIQGKQAAQNYDWSIIGQKFINIYKDTHNPKGC